MAGLGGLNPITPNSTFGPKPVKTDPNSAYNAAILTQGADYDRLMRQYDAMRNTNPIMANYNYYESPEEAALKSQLRENMDTGGFSSGDIGALRERGVSPIRSVYANAMRNASRAKNLAGGYSPNSLAVQAKMAREQSDVVSNATTNVNASIAEMVARGKAEAAGQLAPLATRESTYRAGIDADNVNERRRVETDLPLQLLQGKTSLYGTTPALASMFGQHALSLRGQDLQSQNMQINQDQNRTNAGLNLISGLNSGRTPTPTPRAPRPTYSWQNPTRRGGW